MKCDKSFKRTMLTAWGIKALGQGMDKKEVYATINKMMRKTVDEVKSFVTNKEQT